MTGSFNTSFRSNFQPVEFGYEGFSNLLITFLFRGKGINIFIIYQCKFLCDLLTKNERIFVNFLLEIPDSDKTSKFVEYVQLAWDAILFLRGNRIAQEVLQFWSRISFLLNKEWSMFIPDGLGYVQINSCRSGNLENIPHFCCSQVPTFSRNPHSTYSTIHLLETPRSRKPFCS